MSDWTRDPPSESGFYWVNAKHKKGSLDEMRKLFPGIIESGRYECIVSHPFDLSDAVQFFGGVASVYVGSLEDAWWLGPIGGPPNLPVLP